MRTRDFFLVYALAVPLGMVLLAGLILGFLRDVVALLHAAGFSDGASFIGGLIALSATSVVVGGIAELFLAGGSDA